MKVFNFLKTILVSSVLASSTTLLANDSLINSIGINLANSNTDYEQKNVNGSITLGTNPKKSFNSVEIFTTLNPISSFCKEYNIKPFASYTYSKNSTLKHQYFLIGLNKYFTIEDYKKVEFYTGLLGGYGQMNWRYDPLNNSNNKNEDANSFLGGIQAGVDYSISDAISLGFNTKYLIHEYETKLKTTNAKATMEQDSTFAIGFSLQYSF